MKKIRLLIELSILALFTILLLWVNFKDEIYNSISYHQNYKGEEYSKEFKEIKKEIKSQLGIKYLKLGYKPQEIINDETISDCYYVFIDCKDNNISYEDAYNVIDNCSNFISEKSTKYDFLKVSWSSIIVTL